MILSETVHRMLQNIVGPGHLEIDPVILDSYTFTWLNEFEPSIAPGKFLPHRPAAVVLPGSTAEVQDIVKLCNRYRLKYKALSTGYGCHSLPGQPGVIVLDMNRMNHILHIDEKNKYAVVEPFVNWAQLSAEVLKVGLFTTPIQAGSQASVLANLTSGWGMNVMGTHGGHNGRNVLGVEWVLPTGELLRLGSLDGWFTGDGPGPSLRGIMRGHCGAQGGIGVFTKAAIKLHSWPGSTSLETVPTGMFSNYCLKETPKHLEGFLPCFETYEKMTEAIYKLGEAEICYSLARAGEPEHFLTMIAGGQANHILKSWHESGFIEVAKQQMKHPLMVFIVAHTQREFDYQRQVFFDILAEAGGYISELAEQEMFKKLNSVEMPATLVGNDTHFAHHAGGFVISAGYMGTCASVVRHLGHPAEELKQKYMDDGHILPDGRDSTYMNVIEDNSFVYMELEVHYDAARPESVQAVRRMIAEERNTRRGEKLGFEPNDIALCVSDYDMTARHRFAEMGPHYGNFHLWQEKIKAAFDPNDTSDRSHYGMGLVAMENTVKHNEKRNKEK